MRVTHKIIEIFIKYTYTPILPNFLSNYIKTTKAGAVSLYMV